MKKTRTLALILAILLLAGLFAGCGEKEPAAPQTETPATEAPAQETEAAATTDPRAVTLPLTEDGAAMDLWMASMPGLAEAGVDFNTADYWKNLQEKTNVTLTINAIPVFFAAEQYGIMFASGDYPDMVEGGMQFFTGSPDSAIEDDIIVAFDDFIRELMPNYWYWLQSDEKFDKAAKSVEGHYYAAHCLYVKTAGPATGILIRQDQLDAVGLDVPLTYDEYYEALKAIKAEFGSTMFLDSAGSLPSAMFASGYDVMPYITNGGYEALTVIDGVVEFSPVKDGYRSYLETLNKYWEEGLIYADFMSIESGSRMDEALIYDGSVCLIAGDATGIANYAAGSDGEIQFIGAPSAQVTEDQTIHIRDMVSVLTEGTVITTGCEDVELAAKFLDYQYTDEASLAANYGTEGVSFEYDNGQPKLTDFMLNNPEGTGVMTLLAIYARGDGSYAYDATRTFANFNEAQWQTMETWNLADEAYMYPSRCKMTADDAARYNTIMADAKTFVTEWTLNFILGEKSLETDWAEYISTLEGMNYQDAVALKQAAYDRYIAG